MFWTLFTVNILVKGFVVLGVATPMTLALRRASAAARHAVWALALLSLLALPFLSSVLPSWRMPVPALLLPMTPSLDAPLERDEIAPRLAAGPKAESPTSAGAPTTSPQGPLPSSALSELTPIQSSMSWQAWIVSIWLAGFALFATRILVGLVRSRIAVRSAQEIKNPSWKLLCEGIAD